MNGEPESRRGLGSEADDDWEMAAMELSLDGYDNLSEFVVSAPPAKFADHASKRPHTSSRGQSPWDAGASGCFRGAGLVDKLMDRLAASQRTYPPLPPSARPKVPRSFPRRPVRCARPAPAAEPWCVPAPLQLPAHLACKPVCSAPKCMAENAGDQDGAIFVPGALKPNLKGRKKAMHDLKLGDLGTLSAFLIKKIAKGQSSPDFDAEASDCGERCGDADNDTVPSAENSCAAPPTRVDSIQESRPTASAAPEPKLLRRLRMRHGKTRGAVKEKARVLHPEAASLLPGPGSRKTPLPLPKGPMTLQPPTVLAKRSSVNRLSMCLGIVESAVEKRIHEHFKDEPVAQTTAANANPDAKASHLQVGPSALKRNSFLSSGGEGPYHPLPAFAPPAASGNRRHTQIASPGGEGHATQRRSVMIMSPKDVFGKAVEHRTAIVVPPPAPRAGPPKRLRPKSPMHTLASIAGDASGDDSDHTDTDEFDSSPVESEEHSILRHVTLSTTRVERLQRLRRLAMLKWAPRNDVDANRLSDKTWQQLVEVFQRYDRDRNGCLDAAELHDALADLGVKPSNRSERKEFGRIVKFEGGELDFKQFVRAVADMRGKIQELQYDTIHHTFNDYRRNAESESLQVEQLMDVFKSLSLLPQRDDERIAFLDAILECDVDGSGDITWDEFVPLVQLVREKLYQCRRERELRLKDQLKLKQDIFLHFRDMLVDIHDAFNRVDTEGVGTINPEEACNVIVGLGFNKSVTHLATLCSIDPVLEEFFKGRISFPILLSILQRLRSRGRANTNGLEQVDLRTIFDNCDVDLSGDLSVDEILKLLRDLGLHGTDQPSPDEVKNIIEEADVDGNGTINYEEFHIAYNKIQELMRRRQLLREKQLAEKLGFAEEALWDLREVFAMLDSASCGSVAQKDLAQALQLLGYEHDSWRTGVVNPDGGRLDFEDFLRTMKSIEVTADLPPTRASVESSLRFRLSAQHLPGHQLLLGDGARQV